MKDKEQNFVSAIIYVHNAENRIGEFLKMIIQEMEENFEHSEIICVNDFSSDNSLSIIKSVSMMATSTSVSVINMSFFHGLELAMNAGGDMAIGDFVFEFDHTYMDFDPEMIMRIYRHSLQGFDIVSASPDKKEKLTSRMFYKVFDRFAELSYKMSTESFRVLSRRVINRMNALNKTIPYRKVVYVNSGLKMDNLRYTVKEYAKSSVDKKERNYRSGLAIDSLILFTEFGYRFSMIMVAMMMFMSVFMIVYSAVTYLTAHPIAGWTTTILFLSIAFLGLFGVMTVIIKYLQFLVNNAFKRKDYCFESIEKLTK